MSSLRHLLARSLFALAVSACGDNAIDNDKTAGGQTGGESRQGAPCYPESDHTELSFDAVGPTGISAAEAMARFEGEQSVPGTLAGRPDTSFRALLSYAGGARSACRRLVVDVTLSLRSDDGSFDEVMPARLEVYAADDAALYADYPSQAVHGSYRELLPTEEARELAIGLSFSPGMSGWISLEPGSSGGPSSVLAKF
jgi:hypothetical protein